MCGGMKSLSGWAGPLVGPQNGNYMRKHLVSILCTGLLTIASNPPIHAQGIVANHTSDGRLVYENARKGLLRQTPHPKNQGCSIGVTPRTAGSRCLRCTRIPGAPHATPPMKYGECCEGRPIESPIFGKR